MRVDEIGWSQNEHLAHHVGVLLISAHESDHPPPGRVLDHRLKALTQAKNGFELAEYDLALRGAGEFYGAKQWGISDITMEIFFFDPGRSRVSAVGL